MALNPIQETTILYPITNQTDLYTQKACPIYIDIILYR